MSEEIIPAGIDTDVALHEGSFGVAALLRRMWAAYSPFADSEFLGRMRAALTGLHTHAEPGAGRDAAFTQFHRQFWEINTGCALLEQGVALVPRAEWGVPRDRGAPDLLARVDGKKCWIECVAPSAGDGADAVPEMPMDGTVEDVPIHLFKLRFLSALHNKRTQIAKHIAAGVIGGADAVVVAINSRLIRIAMPDTEPPWIARALYGLGSTAVKVNAGTMGDSILTRERALRKAKGERIDAELFCTGGSPELSGVIYSNADAWSQRVSLAYGLAFVHNVTAKVTLPKTWLPRSTTYVARLEGQYGYIDTVDPVTDDAPARSGDQGPSPSNPASS